MTISGQQLSEVNRQKTEAALLRARTTLTATQAPAAPASAAPTGSVPHASVPVNVPRPTGTGAPAAPTPATQQPGTTAANTPTAAQQQAQAQAAREAEPRIARVKIRPGASTIEILHAITAAMSSPETNKAGAARLQELHSLIMQSYRESMQILTRGY